jgi:hypothetical protein
VLTPFMGRVCRTIETGSGVDRRESDDRERARARNASASILIVRRGAMP